MIAEREAVKRERMAYARGMIAHAARLLGPGEAEEIAAKLYPIPKLERVRVVRDPSFTVYGPASGYEGELHWREFGGRLLPCIADGTVVHQWINDCGWFPTPERVKLWADLIARPTELVDDPE